MSTTEEGSLRKAEEQEKLLLIRHDCDNLLFIHITRRWCFFFLLRRRFLSPFSASPGIVLLPSCC